MHQYRPGRGSPPSELVAPAREVGDLHAVAGQPGARIRRYALGGPALDGDRERLAAISSVRSRSPKRRVKVATPGPTRHG